MASREEPARRPAFSAVPFAPGFRFSALDLAALSAALGMSAGLAPFSPTSAGVVALVTAHFFAFCNVFRIARAPELVWAAVFTALSLTTITMSVPGWPATVAVCVALATALVALEARKPSYHGVWWGTVNPDLPAWWARRHAVSSKEAKSK